MLDKLLCMTFLKSLWQNGKEKSDMLEVKFYDTVDDSLLKFAVIISQSNDNIRIQRQKGCLYVCGVKFETPIDKMRTSLNAGDNIFCPHEVVVPRELDGGHSLVKIIIPAKFCKSNHYL